MKSTSKILMTALMTVLSTLAANAQIYEWQLPPKPTEEYLGPVSGECYAGAIFYSYEGSKFANGQTVFDDRKEKSDTQLYEYLLAMAKSKYVGKCIDRNMTTEEIRLRNFRSFVSEKKVDMPESSQYKIEKYYNLSASVTLPANQHTNKNNPNDGGKDDLTKALDKALQDIREGSRIAIDQVRVPSDVNKEEYKDEVVEILLDKGYKVVAKEYLEKLYEEQQAQQSGIYNDRTTVKDNNFSAVGYYLNVRLTETSLRVQIINVSTGEYDANVTIKF